MAEVIIGIPIKNDAESFKEMIYSLHMSTDAFDKIVLAVGKDTNQESLEAIEWAKNYVRGKGHVEVSEQRFETPLQAYNYLFQIAKEEKADLFLTQTDVKFPSLYKRDWLKQMSDIAQNEQVGAVTSINGGGYSGPDYVDGFYWLGGWCVYYPLRTLELVGGFDENFPNGNGVDIDHSFRISKIGLKIIQVNYWVDHHMMNERLHDRNPNAERERKESAGYFKLKWGIAK